MIENPLVSSLRSFKGNTKYCVYTEPLWGIPNSLFMPFFPVYMSALLVTDEQIGLLASITILVRAICAILSGAITDKFGRKRTTFVGDFFAWSIPCLIWAFSQNFWWFLVAASFNGLWQITDISWTCLLVEDAEKSTMVNIFTWIHISAQFAVFFAPLAGLMVDRMTLVPAMRILLIFSFVSMTAKFIIMNHFCDETRMGKIRKEETKNISIFDLLSGYGKILKGLFSSTAMRVALILTAFFTISGMISQNFFGLYATQNLGAPQYMLALFPIIRSAILLLFFFFIQPMLSHFGYKAPMTAGIILYILSHLMLIFASGNSIAPIIVYTILEACAHGLVIPRKDSLSALFIEPEERARIAGSMTFMVLIVSIPFGYISGLLSSLNRQLPFILNIVIFTSAIIVILKSKTLTRKNLEKYSQ